MSRTILITGCSSGIGAAMARAFRARGHRVYATARKSDSLESLAAEGITTLQLDVNDDASIAAAFSKVEAEAGRLDTLINNAGFSQVGAVLDLTRDSPYKDMEANIQALWPVRLQACQFSCGLRITDRETQLPGLIDGPRPWPPAPISQRLN